jgi:uncharacterized protein
VERAYLLDLNDVIQHPGHVAEIEINAASVEDPDVALNGPITGLLEARLEGSVLHLSGHFDTTAVLECSRCGSDFEDPIEFDLEEMYPIEGVPGELGGFAQVNDSDEPYPLFEGNKLRVEELLRQLLIVELPMNEVCSEACKGLCEVCGHNLNDGPCECVHQSGHPALQNLGQRWRETEKTS